MRQVSRNKSLSENRSVGGSIPPLGTIHLEINDERPWRNVVPAEERKNVMLAPCSFGPGPARKESACGNSNHETTV
jgi:hypothetical protein